MHLVHFGAWVRIGDRRTARWISAVRWRHAGESMIAWRGHYIAGADLCSRSARQRMVARDGRRTGSEFRPSRRAEGANVMALRRDRRNRRSRVSTNDADAAQLPRMSGRRDRGMAVIVVE
jgi:hypothetical protein